jgi:hypothetical protein
MLKTGLWKHRGVLACGYGTGEEARGTKPMEQHNVWHWIPLFKEFQALLRTTRS